jgi:acyl-CoA synthetase (AMP-forming)/AMP-acid ligase II
MIVPDLLRRAAAGAPGRVALVVDGGGAITYGAWEASSNSVARGLLAEGLSPGDRVVLLFPNEDWVAYAVAYFALLKAGGVAVPASPRLAGPEVSWMMHHSGAREILVASDLERLAAGQSEEELPARPAEDDLAEIIYTSGTTGTPKGVASTHQNVTALYCDGAIPFAGATFLHAIPPTTFAGTYAMMVLPVAAVMTIVALPRFDPERYCALVEERRPSVTYLVPAMARLLADSGAWPGRDMSSVRVVRFGTAPMPAGTLARLAECFPRAALLNVYGLTEAGGAGTMMLYDPERPASLGKPIGAARVRVTDERGEARGPGEAGEVWIGLPEGMPSRAYYRDPAATADAFRSGWVRTGDLGVLDEDDYLTLVDRAKDVIIRGGHNVSSVEVEDVLLAHPAVAEAAVVGIPHDVLGEDVAAIVVLRAGERAGADDLNGFCRARLADYKCPRRIEFADGLPRNALGKVLKRELRDRLEAEVRT